MFGRIRNFFRREKPFPLPEDIMLRDGKPIKNKLPDDLANAFKTESQWLDEGRKVRSKAIPTEMYSNASGMCKTYDYYHESQTKKAETTHICAMCRHRSGAYCIFAGDYISMRGSCSEWIDKED